MKMMGRFFCISVRYEAKHRRKCSNLVKMLNIVQHHLGKGIKVNLGRVRVPSRLVVKHDDFDVLETLLLGQ